jgi:hypothetical protein
MSTGDPIRLRESGQRDPKSRDLLELARQDRASDAIRAAVRARLQAQLTEKPTSTSSSEPPAPTPHAIDRPMPSGVSLFGGIGAFAVIASVLFTLWFSTTHTAKTSGEAPGVAPAVVESATESSDLHPTPDQGHSADNADPTAFRGASEAGRRADSVEPRPSRPLRDPPAPTSAPAKDPASANSVDVAPPSAPMTPEDRITMLREESEALVKARAALQSGQGGEALSLVDDARRRFPKGVLGQERDVVSIEAMAISGQRSQALALAKAFVAAHPRSAHSARLRTMFDLEP